MRTAPFASLRSLFAISDEQAMWRVQTQDDERAFAQLVRRWEGPIQRLAARMTGDVHRGEAVVAGERIANFWRTNSVLVTFNPLKRTQRRVVKN